MTEPIVLASTSPRRKEILERVGIPYLAYPPDADERMESTRHLRHSVMEVSRRKVRSVVQAFSGGLVLGVDTVVVFHGRVLGKPADAAQAASYIRMLSGNRHQVLSGITLCDADSGRCRSSCSSTDVYFQELSRSEIDRYIGTGEWADKAGGYGIQGRGALYVRRISGSFFNVVGLPVEELYSLLGWFGYFTGEGRFAPVRR